MQKIPIIACLLFLTSCSQGVLPSQIGETRTKTPFIQLSNADEEEAPYQATGAVDAFQTLMNRSANVTGLSLSELGLNDNQWHTTQAASGIELQSNESSLTHLTTLFAYQISKHRIKTQKIIKVHWRLAHVQPTLTATFSWVQHGSQTTVTLVYLHRGSKKLFSLAHVPFGEGLSYHDFQVTVPVQNLFVQTPGSQTTLPGSSVKAVRYNPKCTHCKIIGKEGTQIFPAALLTSADHANGDWTEQEWSRYFNQQVKDPQKKDMTHELKRLAETYGVSEDLVGSLANRSKKELTKIFKRAKTVEWTESLVAYLKGNLATDQVVTVSISGKNSQSLGPLKELESQDDPGYFHFPLNLITSMKTYHWNPPTYALWLGKTKLIEWEHLGNRVLTTAASAISHHRITAVLAKIENDEQTAWLRDYLGVK